MNRTVVSLVVVSALFTTIHACGTNAEKQEVCAPGDTRICVGPSACVGGQICKQDESGFSDCVCGQAPSSSGAGGTSPAASGNSGPGGATATSGDGGSSSSSVASSGAGGSAVCGNGALDSGEECDDSNANNCDGCESCSKQYVLNLPAKASAKSTELAAGLPGNQSDACYEAWGLTNGTVADAVYLSSTADATHSNFILRCLSGNLVFAVENGAGTTLEVKSSAKCGDNKWHHVVGCRDVTGIESFPHPLLRWDPGRNAQRDSLAGRAGRNGLCWRRDLWARWSRRLDRRSTGLEEPPLHGQLHVGATLYARRRHRRAVALQ